MSWDQEYSVPSIENLFEQLTKQKGLTLLEKELNNQGIRVIDIDEITLDDGMYQTVKGLKVRLSDGRVFVPKLVEKFEENGNHGIDIYEYVLENETPEVKYVDADTTNPDIDVFTVPDEYGEAEADGG